MRNFLDIPDDLRSLIEKREQDDRRVALRRDEDELAAQDVPCSDDRRESQRRSTTPRREQDA